MFSEKLNMLREKNLLRHLIERASPQGPRIMIQGRTYVNFASNDYLGLANHPALMQKTRDAMEQYGFGAGSSRLLGGGTPLHDELEKAIAEFKNTESALVFNSGYSANCGIIPSLADGDAVIFSDELNHASIIDGCRLSKAETIIYAHRDVSHLAECLQKKTAPQKVIVTDAVFSMDGDIAPLSEIVSLCRYHRAYLYIDEAHATGVIGDGKGALSHFRIDPQPWIIRMGTLSKALGSFGAFLAGSDDCIQWAMNRARSFLYSTALPSCVIAASMAALKLIEHDSDLIRRLWRNRDKAARGITAAGYDITGSETPILPVRTGDIDSALRMAHRLFEQGIFAPAIRPPSVREPRIRITVTAAHTDEDIEMLIEALKRM